MRFDYGDHVVVTRTEANGRLVKRTCAIVGITPIVTENQSRRLGHPVGTTMYTVEFGDGTNANIPETDLSSIEG
jgi:hypothetical protein